MKKLTREMIFDYGLSLDQEAVDALTVEAKRRGSGSESVLAIFCERLGCEAVPATYRDREPFEAALQDMWRVWLSKHPKPTKEDVLAEAITRHAAALENLADAIRSRGGA